MFGIYAIVIETSDGPKYYVGSTTRCFKNRYGQHMGNLRKGVHHNHYLQNLWNKYQNIEFRELEVCATRDEIYDKEQRWIETIEPDRLINHGPALPNPCLGTKHSKETRRRLSVSHTNPSPEIRKRYSDGHKGKCLPEEQRKKIGEAHRGRKHTPEIRAKMSEVKKHQSRETRAKISKAKTGRAASEEHRKSLGIAQSRRFENPEERNKSRAGTLAYFERHREQGTHTRLPDDFTSEEYRISRGLSHKAKLKNLREMRNSGEIMPVWVFDHGERKLIYRAP